MTTKQVVAVGAALTGAVLVGSLALYPSLPDRIPIHWGLNGHVDGWGHKRWAAFFGPLGMAAMLGLIGLLPWLSPRSFSVESFRRTFDYVMLGLTALFGFIHAVSLQAALQPEWNSGRVLITGLFLFFALLGNVLGKVRRNFWVGVRTPWTLASDRVWDATHRLAARLLVAAGLLGAVAVFLGVSPALPLAALMAALVVPVFYSLVLYKRPEGG